MEFLKFEYVLWAIALGSLSAISLPLGSVVGLQVRPRPIFISMLGAFGAGALLAALSVELVAPTLFALDEGGDARLHFYALVGGSVLGGVVYFVLDQLVNARGGFLRKTATSITHIRALKRRGRATLIRDLSEFPLLHEVTGDHIRTLLSMVRPVTFNPGETIYRAGDPVNELLFLVSGSGTLSDDGEEVSEFGPGDALGVGSLVLGIPAAAKAQAKGTISALSLSRPQFDRLREIAPEFDKVCRELASAQAEKLDEWKSARHERSVRWLRDAAHAVTAGTEIPNTDQLRRAREEHSGAPLAIWLGMVLDGIPESFVIGAGLLVTLKTVSEGGDTSAVGFWGVVPYTLIAGLFLSNFPEALASSANMRLQGWRGRRILGLWVSLLVITAVGAGVGFVLAESLSHTLLVFAEGLAAGAMLTMIAAAMIPEAVHLGSANLVGLSTLAGFLAAISFKLLE